MISEATFSRSYNSLWNSLAPTADLFVRQINSRLYDRIFPPLKSLVEPARRGLINEIAFEFFCETASRKNLSSSVQLGDTDFATASNNAWQLVGRAPGMQGTAELTEIERDEVTEIARRLAHFFEYSGAVIPKPIFSGCGFIDRCSGDLIVREQLVEVKSGERPFRLIDLRQVLTYLALNLAGNAYFLTGVMLLNPRMGTSVRLSVDELCHEISGKRAVELLTAIIEAISSGDISR